MIACLSPALAAASAAVVIAARRERPHLVARAVDAVVAGGLEHVQFAVRAARSSWRPKTRTAWNTLGVALYRAGEFEERLAAFATSSGTAYDFFFVAMARHKLGRGDARAWFDKAVAWVEKDPSDDEDLKRFAAEVEAVLGRQIFLVRPGPVLLLAREGQGAELPNS